MNIEVIIFWLLILDSLTANIVAFGGQDWYIRHFRLVSRLFPITKGWSVYYLLLVLWAGSILHLAGAL